MKQLRFAAAVRLCHLLSQEQKEVAEEGCAAEEGGKYPPSPASTVKIHPPLFRSSFDKSLTEYEQNCSPLQLPHKVTVTSASVVSQPFVLPQSFVSSGLEGFDIERQQSVSALVMLSKSRVCFDRGVTAPPDHCSPHGHCCTCVLKRKEGSE